MSTESILNYASMAINYVASNSAQAGKWVAGEVGNVVKRAIEFPQASTNEKLRLIGQVTVGYMLLSTGSGVAWNVAKIGVLALVYSGLRDSDEVQQETPNKV